MDERKVRVADTELKLSHGFNEWRRFNIADGAAQLERDSDICSAFIRLPTNLNYADIWLLSRVVRRNLGDAFNPILDCIRYMGDDLHCFP